MEFIPQNLEDIHKILMTLLYFNHENHIYVIEYNGAHTLLDPVGQHYPQLKLIPDEVGIKTLSGTSGR